MPEHPQEQPTRERILDAIRRNPGIHKSDLCRRLGLGWGTVSHHLRRLAASGSIVLFRRGRLTQAVPTGHAVGGWLSMLGMQVGSSLVQELAGRPGQTVSELARSVRLSRNSVRRQLDLLVTNGLLVRLGTPRRSRYELEANAFRRLRALDLLVQSMDVIRALGPGEVRNVLLDEEHAQVIHEAFGPPDGAPGSAAGPGMPGAPGGTADGGTGGGAGGSATGTAAGAAGATAGTAPTGTASPLAVASWTRRSGHGNGWNRGPHNLRI